MATVSTALFTGNPTDYDNDAWKAACVLDKGQGYSSAKLRYAIPVCEPDGTLNHGALQAAAVQLSKSADDLRIGDDVQEDALETLTKCFEEAGLPVREDVEKAKLTSKQRNALPSSAFVFPEDRRYPIHDEAHARNALARSAGKPEEGKVRAAVKRKFPNIDVSKAELGITVPVWKDDAKQIVYGVALTPGLVDSQGDTVYESEIESAAHRFMTDYRKHDVQHDGQSAGVKTVESYIAPQDMIVADQPVLKGSWVVGVHVTDADLWGRVQKGELTGFSIGGTGERF